VSDTPEKIAYDEARHSMTEQIARINDLRTRSATLFSAAAVVTSFLGAEALSDAGSGLGAAEVVAIAAFVGVGVACLYILWPRRDAWLFGFAPAKVVRNYVDGEKRKDPDVIHRDLALHLGQHLQHNAGRLQRLFWAFQAGACLLGVEVIAWMIDLT
jgi:hypothetical protein